VGLERGDRFPTFVGYIATPDISSVKCPKWEMQPTPRLAFWDLDRRKRGEMFVKLKKHKQGAVV
jgi:hypothetical protein